MRATEPLAGIETTRPMRCTGASNVEAGSDSSSEDGATICTSCPCAPKCSARCATCSVTPPGYAKSYGETSASFKESERNGVPRYSSPGPSLLENRPLRRMVGDIVLQASGDSLSYGLHVRLLITAH